MTCPHCPHCLRRATFGMRRLCQAVGLLAAALTGWTWLTTQPAWTLFFYVCAVWLFYGAMALGDEQR